VLLWTVSGLDRSTVGTDNTHEIIAAIKVNLSRRVVSAYRKGHSRHSPIMRKKQGGERRDEPE
jgi:hypothetical protein